MSIKSIIFYIIILNFLFGLDSFAQKQSFQSHDGIKIAYYDEGNGFPVLLLHGFINTADSWYSTPLKDALLNYGYRVIIPDMRGNGNSDKPHKNKYYKNNAERKDLISLIDHLKIETYYAVGYSRGSIVLGDLLKEEKNKIQKAVMGGMGDAFTDTKWEIPNQFAKAFDGKLSKYPFAKGAVEYATSINADLKCLSQLQKFQPTTTKEDWLIINTPILLLNGDQDSYNGDKESLNKIIPNSELIIIKGDHNTCYRSDQFSEEVIKYFSIE